MSATVPAAATVAAPTEPVVRAPSVTRLREVLSAYYDRSTALALALLAADIALFVAGEWLVARGGTLAAALAGSALATLAIVRLFIIGHDACHGSLTDHAALNKLLGRIAFLPSLTPFSLWRVGHNVVHHGFNNLKGRDFVWQPLDPSEWRSLSPARRLLERVYRSAFGPLPYYMVEIWWRRLYFPGRGDAPGRRAEFTWDSVAVTAFATAWIGALVVAAPAARGAVALAILLGFLAPFLIWTWVVGFVVYLHHTHPDVVWYADKSAWLKAQGILHGTVRYRVRPWWNWLLHNIMEHAAHHLDPRIPLYRLKAAQGALARLVPDIPVVELSLRTYWRSVRQCKLFDFERRRWVGFPRRAAGEA
ncbi:MAG TPA: fatty acid desaturase [Steroidobacteraceae bacterium]|nr:fatty acid desaturase [Steroidobacteraceae bacterium]